MQKHKIIFCRKGIISEFYTAVSKQSSLFNTKVNVDIVSYGAATNSIGYPRFYLANKYGKDIKSNGTAFNIYLCYDYQSVKFEQISPEIWIDIDDELINMFNNINVTHIIHKPSIEDWLFSDIQGLSRFFNKNVELQSDSGRNRLMEYYHASGKAYVSSNETECKKLISTLGIKRIATAHMEELTPLFL